MLASIELQAHGLCLWVLCVLGKTDQLRAAGIVGLLGECLVSVFLGEVLGLVKRFRW